MARRRGKRRYYTPTPEVQPSTESTTSARLALWRKRVEQAQQVREDWERRYRVEELEKLYLGERNYNDREVDEAWYNHFFATIRVQLPSLFFTNPSFRARPRPGNAGEGTQRAAAMVEGLLQAIAREENNLETEGKLALLQAFFRMGCLKCCYEPKFEPNPNAGEPMTVSVFGLEQPLIDERGQRMTEPETVLSDELYAWEWVDARKMLLPNEGPSQRRWTWIGEEIEVSLEEAKADTRYPAALRKQMVSNATAARGDRYQSGYQADNDAEPADQLFRYIECWSIEEKRLYCWAEGQLWSDADFLLDEPYPDGIDDHPYALLSFLPIVGPRPLPWPLPLTYNWLPLQKEYDRARDQVTSAGNRAARKILYDRATFPDAEEARKALASSVDMEGVELTDLGRPPLVFGADSLSQDVGRSVAAIQYDWRVITGATGTRLSGQRDANTATEAALTEKAATLRDSEGQAQVAAWLATAGSKMLQLIRQTLTLDYYIMIRGFNDAEFQRLITSQGFQQALVAQYGPELGPRVPALLPFFPALQAQFRRQLGEEHPLKVTRENLQFDMSIDVIPASLGLRTLESEKASWLQFLTVIGQFPQLLQSRALLEETASKFQFLGEAVVDELLLLGQQVAQQQAQALQARQGGSRQGTSPAPPVPNGQLPPIGQQAL